MNLEIRMENILRTTSIAKPQGRYKDALNRLVKKGRAVKRENTYMVPIRFN